MTLQNKQWLDMAMSQFWLQREDSDSSRSGYYPKSFAISNWASSGHLDTFNSWRRRQCHGVRVVSDQQRVQLFQSLELDPHYIACIQSLNGQSCQRRPWSHLPRDGQGMRLVSVTPPSRWWQYTGSLVSRQRPRDRWSVVLWRSPTGRAPLMKALNWFCRSLQMNWWGIDHFNAQC